MAEDDALTAGLPAMRLAMLHRELAAASTAAECLPALVGLAVLAEEMVGRGSDHRAAAGRVLDDVLRYLRAARPQLPPGSTDALVALYLEAESCRIRDLDGSPVSDLDNAIGCLRQLRAALPANDPDLTEVEVKLASALFIRTTRREDPSADLRDARQLLAGVLHDLAADDPRRPEVCAALAMQCAAAFVAFGGPQADWKAGIAYARECAATPGETADTGHFVLAWLTLTRQLTTQQRSAMYRQSPAPAEWRETAVMTAALSELGEFTIEADDGEAALAHLRQVSAAPASDAVRGMLPTLWMTALSVVLRGGSPETAVTMAEDFQRLRDAVLQARTAVPEDELEADVLDVMSPLAALLAQQTDGEESVTQFAAALEEIAAQLPTGHPARSVGVGLFSSGLASQAQEARTAPDPAAQAARIMAALGATASPADPELARATLPVGLRLFGLSAEHRSVLRNDRIAPQFRQATAGLAADDPLKPLADFTYWTSVCMQATLQQQPPHVIDSAIAELKRCAEAVPPGHLTKTYMLVGVAFALMDRHSTGGEIRHLEEARRYLTRAFDSVDAGGQFAEGSAGYGGLLYARGHLELMWCSYGADPERLSSAVADLERAASMTEEGTTLRLSISSELETAQAMLETTQGAPEGEVSLGPLARQAFDRLQDTAATLSPDHPEYPAVLAQAGHGLMLRALADKDRSLMDQAIKLFGDACATPGLALRERSQLLATHGFALQTRYLFGGRDSRDLSNAIGRLEEARRVVEQSVGSPYAAQTLQALAAVYRLRGDAGRGDVDRAVSYGLAGLREHVGDVLLQDSDESALHIARRGTSDAAEMARWFLRRGRDAAAVSALELSRGMVLYAATSGISLPEALRQAGQAGLAEEWTRATEGGQAADDLRFRVMLALERSPVEAQLLSAPSVGDIAAALAEAEADALVYLLPRDDDGPGLAVIVDRHKGVRGLTLPRLPVADGEPLRGFLRARRAAEQSGAPADIGAWQARLGELCGWAWASAVEPLLAAVPAGDGGAERRIVLVPCGQLGLVPWHAARAPGGGYACQQAVLSYASSARQFIDAVRSRPRPWAEAPVLVSDSEASLALSAGCVRHLFDQYYQAASVFGFARTVDEGFPLTVPGADAARSADVLAALPGPGAGAGSSVLHFGCHGRTQLPVLRSYLDLGDNVKLRVQDILRQARARPSGQSAAGTCGLAVLASCLSDVTDADYDEALTLATAFLSAGVGGVVAARWMVAENATSLFMAMFHHYLNSDGLSPPRALQAAQLWMLDPDREIPARLPAALLDEAEFAREPDGPDLADPAAWASFVYQGR